MSKEARFMTISGTVNHCGAFESLSYRLLHNAALGGIKCQETGAG